MSARRVWSPRWGHIHVCLPKVGGHDDLCERDNHIFEARILNFALDQRRKPPPGVDQTRVRCGGDIDTTQRPGLTDAFLVRCFDHISDGEAVKAAHCDPHIRSLFALRVRRPGSGGGPQSVPFQFPRRREGPAHRARGGWCRPRCRSRRSPRPGSTGTPAGLRRGRRSLSHRRARTDR